MRMWDKLFTGCLRIMDKAKARIQCSSTNSHCFLPNTYNLGVVRFNNFMETL